MKTLKVNSVIFDLDGVITDTMPYHYKAWKKVFAGQGLKVDECEIYLREGQPGRLMIRHIFNEHGMHYDQEQADRMLEEKEKIFKKTVKPDFVPGSRQFLNYLRSRGIRTALVSGTALHEIKEMLTSSFLKKFTTVVAGDEVKHGKPDPEPFLRGLDKLKIKAKDAIVVENAPYGIFSAKSAGLRCIALETYLDAAYLKQANFIFSSYKELRQNLDFKFSA